MPLHLRVRLAAGLAGAALLLAAGGEAHAAKAPKIRAPSAIVVDAQTGAVLYAKAPDRRRSIASTTKLMTALLAVRATRPNQVIEAAPYSAQPVESKIDLRPGERMTARDLLQALLLESANDAAATLARGVAGSQDAFVERMNEQAARLGLRNTAYANPIGFDHPRNYSTARDLATLARHVLREGPLARIVDLPRAKLASGGRPRTVLNRNRLVRSHPFVAGVKTGHTNEAGYVLVGSAERAGGSVISVVLGEPSEAARDAETLKLLRYGLSRFTSVHAVSTVRALTLVPVNYYSGMRIPLHAARDVRLSVLRGARVHTFVRQPFPLHLTGPMRAGTTVGEVTVTVNGTTAAKVPLVTGEKVPGGSWLRQAAIDAGRTRPTLALGLVGVILLALLQLRGPVSRLMRR